MNQTLALLVDAYRELNARRLFWVSLIISGLVVGVFALLGLGPDKLTVLGMDLPIKPPAFWYKWAFSKLVIGIWVEKAAMVLALISTASIFPELMAGGSIDLYLSRPIGRFRLFLTKYVGGLLFVLLQVTVFAAGCYLVFGLRAGQWRPNLFLIVPLAGLLFSYLFAVCVLVGVLTRSTLAAILVTCVFWVLCMIGNTTERTLFQLRAVQTAQVRSHEREAEQAEADLATLKQRPSVLNAFGFRERRLADRRDQAKREAEAAGKTADKLSFAHRIAYAVTTLIPKTGETVDLLDRNLFDDADLSALRERMMADGGPAAPPEPIDEAEPPIPPTLGSTPTPPATNPASITSPASAASLPSATSPTTAPALPDFKAEEQTARDERRKRRRQQAMEAQEQAERAERSRSVPWILGTSVAFELVVLGVASWVFCRRDY